MIGANQLSDNSFVFSRLAWQFLPLTPRFPIPGRRQALEMIAVQKEAENVLVIGGSYAGGHAAVLLSQVLPSTYRVIVVDQQSHLNHVYLFPRFGVVPGHAHKAFVPFTHFLGTDAETVSDSEVSLRRSIVLPPRHLFIHARVSRIGDGTVEIDRSLRAEELAVLNLGQANNLADGIGNISLQDGESGDQLRKITWRYLIIATGSTLPPPLLSPARTKEQGLHFLDAQQASIARSNRIVIAGGGALGIQYATDIADLYNNPANRSLRHKETSGLGTKAITLIHSRSRFLPLYGDEVHDEVMQRLEELGVEVVLGERIEMSSSRLCANNTRSPATETEKQGARVLHNLKTDKGREIECDLLLRCTGQKPNSELISSWLPASIATDGHVNVLDTLQIEESSDIASKNTPEQQSIREKVFVIGDVANAGVIKAGHTGWNQAEVAVQNVMCLISSESENSEKWQSAEKANQTLDIAKELPERFSSSVSTLLSSSDSTCGTSKIEATLKNGKTAAQLVKYERSVPQIKVTLGLKHSVAQVAPWPSPTDGKSIQTEVKTDDSGILDGHWQMIWKRMAVDPTNPFI